jgi:hypothetical protein
MLSHCANSQCSKPFLNLREGKLFVIEADRSPQNSSAAPFVRVKTRKQKLEHYWLCDECAAVWTLVSDHNQGIEMISLRRPMHTVRALDGIRSGMGRARLQIVPPGA